MAPQEVLLAAQLASSEQGLPLHSEGCSAAALVATGLQARPLLLGGCGGSGDAGMSRPPLA